MNEIGNFNEEKNRLLSFSSWPAHYPVHPSRLAKAGFYYSGTGDEVICFSCNGHLNNWQYGTVVQKRHMELFPHCDFVNRKSNNISIMNNKLCDTSEKIFKKELDAFREVDTSDGNSKKLHDSSELSRSNHNLFNCTNYSRVRNQQTLYFLDTTKLLCERERLKTFFHWPVPSVSVDLLAKAGFFYLGCKDKVQCAFCYGIVKNWHNGDIPILEHKKHFPHCKFVLKYKCSLGSDHQHESQEAVSVEKSDMSYKLLNSAQIHSLDQLGINIYHGPAHPCFATLTARLQSFATWPDAVPVSKEKLAIAGFFYVGSGDRTKCFHCNGGLHCWETDDDPWKEHARWFQNCSFIRLNKGHTFISSVKSEKAEHDSQNLSVPCLEPVKTVKYGEAEKADRVSSVILEPVIPDQLEERKISCENFGYRSTEPSKGISNILSISRSDHQSDIPCSDHDLLENSQLPLGVINEESGNLSKNEKEIWKNWFPNPSERDQCYSDDQGVCKVCMDNDINVAFLPCGHVLVCAHCASVLNECPMCWKPIQATVRVYLQ